MLATGSRCSVTSLRLIAQGVREGFTAVRALGGRVTPESRELAWDCRALLEKSGVEAPALKQLYAAVEAYALGVRKS